MSLCLKYLVLLKRQRLNSNWINSTGIPEFHQCLLFRVKSPKADDFKLPK